MTPFKPVCGPIELLGDGVPRPDDLPALASAIGAEFAACQAARGNREISSLAELPPH
jgi:hypothetical protein